MATRRHRRPPHPHSPPAPAPAPARRPPLPAPPCAAVGAPGRAEAEEKRREAKEGGREGGRRRDGGRPPTAAERGAAPHNGGREAAAPGAAGGGHARRQRPGRGQARLGWARPPPHDPCRVDTRPRHPDICPFTSGYSAQGPPHLGGRAPREHSALSRPVPSRPHSLPLASAAPRARPLHPQLGKQGSAVPSAALPRLFLRLQAEACGVLALHKRRFSPCKQGDCSNLQTLPTQQALTLTHALLHSLPERPGARRRSSLLLSESHFVSVRKTGLKSGSLGFWSFMAASAAWP